MATGASSATASARNDARRGPSACWAARGSAASILIVLGVIFLLQNFGYADAAELVGDLHAHSGRRARFGERVDELSAQRPAS